MSMSLFRSIRDPRSTTRAWHARYVGVRVKSRDDTKGAVATYAFETRQEEAIGTAAA